MKFTLKSAELTKPLRLATGQSHVVCIMIPRLRIRLDVDPAAPQSWDDRFELTIEGPSGKKVVCKTVKDDLVPGDNFVDLDFGIILHDRTYTLAVDPGAQGEPYPIFEKVSGQTLMQGKEL